MNDTIDFSCYSIPEQITEETLVHPPKVKPLFDYANQFIDKVKNSGISFSLMPAGSASKSLYSLLKRNDISTCSFIDNHSSSTEIYGIPVKTLDVFNNDTVKPIIILAVLSENIRSELVAQLESNKCNYLIFDVQKYIDSIVNTKLWSKQELLNARNIFKKNLESLNNVYTKLKDRQSRITLLNLLKFRITLDQTYLKEVIQLAERQYFEPSLYSITNNDSFIDCGVYTGDTFEDLIDITQGSIEDYYGFEPSEELFQTALQKIQQYPGCKLYPLGAFSHKTLLHFDISTDLGSHKIDDTGSTTINVDSLDNVLKNKRVTFIKMDIEGAEIEALHGARQIIESQMPVLAISIYHHFNDLWEIPQTISSFNCSYNFHIRHYTLNSAETVLYCIPK